MYQTPDFVTWASHVALSPHAIACLSLGVVPTTDPAPGQLRGHAPPMPEEAEDLLHDEWTADYERIYLVLKNAIDSGRLTCPHGGAPALESSVTYLAKVAEENGWLNILDGNPLIEAVSRRVPDHLTMLRCRIADLEAQLCKADETIKQLRRRGTYTTPLLTWLDEVVSEFFHDDNLEEYPTGKAVEDWIVSSSRARGEPISRTSAQKIAAVLTPESRRRGGRPPKRA